MPLCPFYGPLSSIRPLVPSTAICPPLKPYVPATALVPLYDTLYPPLSYVPSTALCHAVPYPFILSMAFWPSAPLQHSVLSIALCLLYDPPPSIWRDVAHQPSVFSTTLSLLYSRPLYGSLSPLQPSVPSTALLKEQ
jgi:hypothetical protein